ncbi:MAG: Rrf2 family transcriptional regulator [Candidatus Omnitrophota bacterium]
MKVSTRARYGVRLMLQLALNDGNGPFFLKDIARKQEISEKYLSQIIIPLKAKGLVNSIRGAKGGYTLARDMEKITMKDIVEPLEGKFLISDSGTNRSVRCVSRNLWTKLGKAISDTLSSVTLKDLVDEYNQKGKIVTYQI